MRIDGYGEDGSLVFSWLVSVIAQSRYDPLRRRENRQQTLDAADEMKSKRDGQCCANIGYYEVQYSADYPRGIHIDHASVIPIGYVYILNWKSSKSSLHDQYHQIATHN